MRNMGGNTTKRSAIQTELRALAIDVDRLGRLFQGLEEIDSNPSCSGSSRYTNRQIEKQMICLQLRRLERNQRKLLRHSLKQVEQLSMEVFHGHSSGEWKSEPSRSSISRASSPSSMIVSGDGMIRSAEVVDFSPQLQFSEATSKLGQEPSLHIDDGKSWQQEDMHNHIEGERAMFADLIASVDIPHAEVLHNGYLSDANQYILDDYLNSESCGVKFVKGQEMLENAAESSKAPVPTMATQVAKQNKADNIGEAELIENVEETLQNFEAHYERSLIPLRLDAASKGLARQQCWLEMKGKMKNLVLEQGFHLQHVQDQHIFEGPKLFLASENSSLLKKGCDIMNNILHHQEDSTKFQGKRIEAEYSADHCFKLEDMLLLMALFVVDIEILRQITLKSQQFEYDKTEEDISCICAPQKTFSYSSHAAPDNSKKENITMELLKQEQKLVLDQLNEVKRIGLITESVKMKVQQLEDVCENTESIQDVLEARQCILQTALIVVIQFFMLLFGVMFFVSRLPDMPGTLPT